MDEPKPDIHTIRFIALIDSFYGAAMTFLGKTTDPTTGETVRELEKAQAYIEFLDTLRAKTEGNLSGPERDHLDRLLSTLRLNYVDEADAAKEEAEKAETNGRGETDGEEGERAGEGNEEERGEMGGEESNSP